MNVWWKMESWCFRVRIAILKNGFGFNRERAMRLIKLYSGMMEESGGGWDETLVVGGVR